MVAKVPREKGDETWRNARENGVIEATRLPFGAPRIPPGDQVKVRGALEGLVRRTGIQQVGDAVGEDAAGLGDGELQGP